MTYLQPVLVISLANAKDSYVTSLFLICSSYGKFYKEIVKLKEIFKGNSYPEKTYR